MNKIILTNARLGKDVDIRYSNEKTIARFSVATDRRFSKEKKADWFNCVCFSAQATFAEKYLHKGSKVNIIGRVQPDFYENKEGQRVNTFDVIVEEIEFAESKKDAENNAPAETPTNAPAKTPADDGGFDGFEVAVDDSDLPFN